MPAPRFLSKFEEANPEKAKRLEYEILHNIDYTQERIGKPYCFQYIFSFFLQVLPALQHKDRHYVQQWSSLIYDLDMKDDLERTGVINWCPNASRLFPIKVKGDGNCLIHAISVAVWGIEDLQLNIRRLLASTLMMDPGQKFQSRWKQYQKNQDREMLNRPSLNHVTLDDDQWAREWEQVIHSAGADSAAMTGIAAMPYVHLEAVHVYVLANIFRRPIILLGKESINTFSGSSMQINNLMGIYLPLERDAAECCSVPIILGFSMNHICPLLGLDTQFDIVANKTGDYLPLITAGNSALPVRFLKNNEERCANDLLKKYLKMKEFKSISGSHVGAVIEYKPMPPHLNLLEDYQAYFERKYRECFSQHLERNIRAETPGVQPSIRRPSGNQQSVLSELNAQYQVTATPPSSRPATTDPLMQEASNQFTPVPCKMPNCQFFGNPAQGGMCTKCLQEYLKNESSCMQTELPGTVTVIPPVLEAVVATPSAPPPSMPLESPYIDISLMGELCHGKCGYRCSSNTYPYCHECAEKSRREALKIQQTDPVRARTPQQLSVANIEANRSTGEAIRVNEKYIAENLEGGISAGELFGSGNNVPAPMQESCAEILPSSLDIACITPLCIGKGKAIQGDRCSRCFVENAPIAVATAHAQIATSEISTRPQIQQTPILVGSSLNLLPSTGSFSKCVTPECVNPGFPGNSGYCPNCAVKLIEASTGDEDAGKKICSIPGCHGMRLKGGYCDKCYHQFHRRSQSPVENMAMAEVGESSDLENSLIISASPSGLSAGEEQQVVNPGVRKKCASPMCSMMIYSPASLCEGCLSILRKSSATQGSVPMSSSSQPGKQNVRTAPIGNKCIMPGCNKSGDPTTADMCLACYQFQFELTAPSPGVRVSHTAPIMVSGPRPVQRSHTAPQGHRCIVAGCAKFGDPATGNMCTACYQRHSVTQPAPLGFQPAAVTTEVGMDERFNCMMNKVENVRKIQKTCKKATCYNRANPAKEGFCNSCYQEYEIIKQGMAMDGETRCG